MFSPLLALGPWIGVAIPLMVIIPALMSLAARGLATDGSFHMQGDDSFKLRFRSLGGAPEGKPRPRDPDPLE